MTSSWHIFGTIHLTHCQHTTKCCANGNFHISTQRPVSALTTPLQHPILMTSAAKLASSWLGFFGESGCLSETHVCSTPAMAPVCVYFQWLCQPVKGLWRRVVLPGSNPSLGCRPQMFMPHQAYVRRKKSDRFAILPMQTWMSGLITEPDSCSLVVWKLKGRQR